MNLRIPCLSRGPRVVLAGSLIGLACSAHQTPPPVPPPSQAATRPATTPATPPPAAAASDVGASEAKPAPAGGIPVSVAPVGPEAVVAAGPGWSIITTAPEGLTASDLGRVFDSAFQPLAGRRALFKTKAPEGYPVFRHSVALVEDRITLAATVRSWGLATDAGRNRRFASYRAEQITEIHGVDDMAPPDPAPEAATYYLAKVYYGRSFEVRLSGEEKQFHSGLAGVFLSGKLDGGLKSFAEKNRLEFAAVGRGLRPKSGAAIYAKEPEEIEQNYTADGSPAVPIEVEYRLIPGRSLPNTEPILWRKQSRYRVELSAVEARGCDKTSACDLSVSIGSADGSDKGKTYRSPDDSDLWEPRYLLLETTEEAELARGWNIEVTDRDLTLSHLLGRCQVRVDARRLRAVDQSPDRRNRWTELCGKAQVRLTVTGEDAN